MIKMPWTPCRKEHTLTRDFFRLWLERCEPDAVVGCAQAACDCPIAKHLAWETGGIWSVGGGVYKRLGELSPELVEYMPTWARSFVAEVDRGGRNNITAAECLAALDKIPDTRVEVTA
jgi:hypothetical protein